MSTIARTTFGVEGLLEREDALATLHNAFSEARAGRGRLVLVAGEAGIGKTAVLRRFADERRSSARVLWGACEPLFTPRPLGPIIDIAQSASPDLAGLVQGEPLPFRVATALLGELGGRVPTALVIEDLHWADEATLDVLRFVIRRLGELPALLVLSYRDVGLDVAHPLRIVLGDLGSGHLVDRIRLSPLSLEAVAELSEPYDLDAEELHRITDGNPFFVTEVLAWGGVEIPDTIRDAVHARAARLTPHARTVLEAAAIAPWEIDVSLLDALIDEPGSGLDECLASGMLTVTDTGAVTFRHELARLAIEEVVPHRTKMKVHRRALDELGTHPEQALDLARLAYHAEAVGDTEAVLRFAPAAGARASSLGAHREAAEQYARALRFSDGLSAETLAELLERRSHECYLSDHADEAIGALERAADCYRTVGDRRREGDTLRRLSHILWCPGRGAEGRVIGLAAVALLEALPPGRELANAYANLSFLFRSTDPRAAREWGERALELAERLGDPETLSNALIIVGVPELAQGREQGRRALERSLALAEREGLEKYVADALFGLASAPAYQRSYDVADSYFETGLAYCTEHGNDLMRLYFLAYRARTELERGRWAAGAESARLVLAERVVSTFPRTLALVVLGLVRARRGDPDVEPLLDEARDLADPTGELPRIALVAAGGAEAAWLRGDDAEVGELTSAAVRLALERRSARVLGELGVWRRRAGIEGPPSEPFVEEPYAAELGGDWSRAAAMWAAYACPYEEALALASADTEAPLRRAHERLLALGARPAAGIVARRLRKRGVRGVPRGPGRVARASAAGLTSREGEVLRLLAEGLTNARIAERLFLSRRTVDHHVSAILRKLGAHTRGEAVALAGRLELLKDR